MSETFQTIPLWLSTLITFISSGVAATVVAFIFKSTFKLGRLREKFDVVIKDISSLKKNVNILTSRINKLAKDMLVVKTHLTSKSNLDVRLFNASSPLQLTAEGKKLLKESGFKKMYQNKKNWFVEQVKLKQPQMESEVDEISTKLIEKYIFEKKAAHFKEVAYQSGYSLILLSKVLSIYLRTELLKEIRLANN